MVTALGVMAKRKARELEADRYFQTVNPWERTVTQDALDSVEEQARQAIPCEMMC